jgi:uncharacterized protein
MRFFSSLVFLLAVLGSSAQAQQAEKTDRPLMGSEASPQVTAPEAPDAAPAADAQLFRILVVGDALAGNLGAGMTRIAQDNPNIDVLNRFNESSGLARSEVYDWPSAITKITAGTTVDAIVVLLGVNDRQTIRTDGERHDFKSPEWIKLYIERIDRLLDATQKAKAKIYWISLPPMADPAFDADMRYMTDLHRARVAEKGGHFIDVRPFFTAPDGSYTDRGPDDKGQERKLRASNGVTFFKEGSNRFGQLVLGAIRSLEDQKTAVKPEGPQTIAPATENQEPDVLAAIAAPPSFGQRGIDGEDVTFRADAIRPMAPKPVSVAQRQPLAADGKETRIIAKSGSESAKLMEQGDIPTAPAGRFDDFTVPAPE